jgi:hypothetical protein
MDVRLQIVSYSLFSKPTKSVPSIHSEPNLVGNHQSFGGTRTSIFGIVVCYLLSIVWTLKMEVVRSLKPPVKFYQTIGRHIPQASNLQHYLSSVFDIR